MTPHPSEAIMIDPRPVVLLHYKTILRRLESMQTYYRVPAAAQLLGLNVSALYKIIRDGGLDTYHKHPLTITKQSMFKFLESRHPGLRLICTAGQG